MFATQVPVNWHKRTQLGIIGTLVRFKIQACSAVGPIAQSVEQRTFNPWVDGSSPSGPTTHFSKPRLCAGFSFLGPTCM